MRSRFFAILLVVVAVALAACGSPSKEDVVKKLSGKWEDAKGYELEATMEIKTGAEPRTYDVEVWHTKPEFYRVHVSQEGQDESQMIVRNDEGVFVVTPSLGKTYKFQSDWPAQNSQAYLIGALAEDIKVDKNATMSEEEKTYVFETETRNNHKKVLPTQQIHVDKKTLLPKHVSVLDENGDEQIRISFKKITLGTKRDASEYDVKVNDEKANVEEAEDEEAEAETDADTEANDEVDEEAAEEESESSEQTGFNIHYPAVDWEVVAEEETVETENGIRSFMTYGGEREFIIIQERAKKTESQLPVSIEGDPVDLGFTVAALTENSLRWEANGVSFFIASETLTAEEMIMVANSMSATEMK